MRTRARGSTTPVCAARAFSQKPNHPFTHSKSLSLSRSLSLSLYTPLSIHPVLSLSLSIARPLSRHLSLSHPFFFKKETLSLSDPHSDKGRNTSGVVLSHRKCSQSCFSKVNPAQICQQIRYDSDNKTYVAGFVGTFAHVCINNFCEIKVTTK